MQKISNLEEEDSHVVYWGAGGEYAVSIEVSFDPEEETGDAAINSTCIDLTMQDLVDMLEVIDYKDRRI